VQHKILKLSKRNPSYLDSLKTALVSGIYWAPSSFVATVKMPALMTLFAGLNFLLGVIGLTITILMWCAGRVAILGAGVAGFLREIDPSPKNNQG